MSTFIYVCSLSIPVLTTRLRSIKASSSPSTVAASSPYVETALDSSSAVTSSATPNSKESSPPVEEKAAAEKKKIIEDLDVWREKFSKAVVKGGDDLSER